MDGQGIFVVEGIVGSGKSLYARRLLQQLRADQRPVHHFDEDAMGMSWRHVGLRDIDVIRQSLMEAVVTLAEEEFDRDPRAVFVLNRFHLSFSVMNRSEHLLSRYEQLLDRLRQLPVEVHLLVLDPGEIERRVRHIERASEDFGWVRFLEERLAGSPYASLGELYAAQQQTFIHIAQTQGLPCTIEYVVPPGDADGLSPCANS